MLLNQLYIMIDSIPLMLNQYWN